MALLLPRSIFFHIPKTGGMWVRRAIARAKIPTDEIGRPASGNPIHTGVIVHCDPRKVFFQGRLRFGFVRHPLRLYQSYWCFRMRHPHSRNPFDVQCLRDDFQEFVWTVLREHPGWVSRSYKRFCGADLELLDFIGRQENLADDLVAALTLAGEQFDEQVIRTTAPQNVTPLHDPWRQQCTYTPALLEALATAEQFALEAFGYKVEDLLEVTAVTTAAPMPVSVSV